MNSFIKPVIIVGLVLISTLIIIDTYLVNSKHNEYNKEIDILISHNIEPKIICVLTECIAITINEDTYIRNNNTFIESGMVYEHNIFISPIYRMFDDGNTRVTLQYDYSTLINIIVGVLVLVNVRYMLLFIILFRFFLKKTELILHRNKHIEKFKLSEHVKHTVTAMLRHEMALPIGTIAACAGELGTPDIPPENVKKYLGLIYNSTSRLNSLLATLTNTNEVISDDVSSLYQLLEVTSESMKFHFLQTNYTYRILSRDILEKYRADNLSTGTLANIINNVIKNSLEAGSTHIEVNVRKSTKNNYLRIYISDNGTGIPGDNLASINNEVFKSGTSTKDTINDYKLLNVSTTLERSNKLSTSDTRGLGLNLCKTILNEVGGDITVHSTSTAGTVVCIKINVVSLT